MNKTLVVNKAQMKTICEDWLNEKYFKQEVIVTDVKVDHADSFTITFNEKDHTESMYGTTGSNPDRLTKE